MSREHKGLFDRTIFDHGEVQRRLQAGAYTRCPPRAASAPIRLNTLFAEDRIPEEWSQSEMATWYVVSVESNKEYRMRDRLDHQGWSVWLPECVIERKHKCYQGLINRLRGPLFPGYLFVRFDILQAQWRRIEEIEGIERVLRHGDWPRALPAAEIERLQRLAEADGGAIVIKAGMPRREYVEGELLRVIAGPFTGFEAVYDSPDAKDRINILLDILGATRVIAVSSALVEPA